ncbi:myelin protein zero-like protein 3 [Eudromia elegans]
MGGNGPTSKALLIFTAAEVKDICSEEEEIAPEIWKKCQQSQVEICRVSEQTHLLAYLNHQQAHVAAPTEASVMPPEGKTVQGGMGGAASCRVCRALSLEIKASSKVRAFIGEQVSLKCSFTSAAPVTESLTVDWTYRPLTEGPMETIFHYQTVPYPTTVGKFKDRILWIGNIAKGDASIAIHSPTMSDNGTFICSVKNPPDVYHNIPQTVLTVTERGLSFQLTSAMLLSILVFLPSVLVVILLLVRMGKKFGVLKEKKKSVCKKSSIEVSDEPEYTETGNCLGRLKVCCWKCVVSES